MDPKSHAISNARFIMSECLRTTDTVAGADQSKVVPNPLPAAIPVIVEQKAIQEKAEPKYTITTAKSAILEITGQEQLLLHNGGFEPSCGAILNIDSISIFTTSVHPAELNSGSTYSFTGFDPKGRPNIVLTQDEFQVPEFRSRPADAVRINRMHNGISKMQSATADFLDASGRSTAVEAIMLAYV